MKKILSLLLVLMLAVSLVACGGAAKEDTSEKDATKVVEKFMDALIEFDADEAEKYIDDPDEIPEEFRDITNLDGLMGNVPAEFEMFEDKFKKMAEDIIDKFRDEFKYEIKETEKDGENVIVTVVMEGPEPSGIEELGAEISSYASNLTEEDANAYLERLLQSGKITESSTQEDLLSALFDLIIDDMIKYISDYEFETEEKEFEFVVVNEDGEWVIDTKESELFE